MDTFLYILYQLYIFQIVRQAIQQQNKVQFSREQRSALKADSVYHLVNHFSRLLSLIQTVFLNTNQPVLLKSTKLVFPSSGPFWPVLVTLNISVYIHYDLFWLVESTKMNYAQAARGHHTRGGVTRAIQSQAETELGRKLSNEEEIFLSTKFSPCSLLDEIKKVGRFNKIVFIYLIYISMDMVTSSFCCSWKIKQGWTVTLHQHQHLGMEIVSSMQFLTVSWTMMHWSIMTKKSWMRHGLLYWRI